MTSFKNDSLNGSVDTNTLSADTTITQGVQIATAAGSNSQSGSTLITAPVCMVATAAATTRGVRLPTAATGLTVTVISAVTTNSKVYPGTNGKIGSAATNAVTSLAAGAARIYVAQNTTQWRVASNS